PAVRPGREPLFARREPRALRARAPRPPDRLGSRHVARSRRRLLEPDAARLEPPRVGVGAPIVRRRASAALGSDAAGPPRLGAAGRGLAEGGRRTAPAAAGGR